MTTKENLTQALLDKRVLVCGILMSSMMLTTGFTANKHVTIAVDGHTVELNTSYRTPANILSQAGVTMQDEDSIKINYDENGNTILTVERAVPVTVEFEGNKIELMTSRHTVEEVMGTLGYVGDGYVVDKALDSAIETGMTIKVDRAKSELEYEPLNMYNHGYHSGNILNTEDGAFEYQQCITMEATAYLPTDGSAEGITATGIRATYGIVAVDPDIIPLGTELYIPGYGHALAADTGGAIYGDRIDLCMEGYDEAMAFGRRDVDVYILK